MSIDRGLFACNYFVMRFRILTCLIAAVFSLSLASSGFGQNDENQLMSFEGFSDDEVFELAKSGDARAQFEMGHRLVLGDIEKAGEANAVSQDAKEEALGWFTKSAENGYAEAYTMLSAYHISWTDEPDIAKAIEYWDKAIELGSWTAKLNYGISLYNNPNHEIKAYKYLIDVADKVEQEIGESPTYHQSLFEVYSFGRGGQKVQLEKAIQHGKLCAYGENALAYCQFLLGRYYEMGWAEEKDLDKAAELFLSAAEGGNPNAQWKIGMFHLDGSVLEKDEVKAFDWVEKSANGDYLNGMISLAVMHALGQGTPVDDIQSYQWYDKAARLGSYHALRSLAFMTIRGEGVEADQKFGVAALILASEGDENAIVLLRTIFDDYDENSDFYRQQYADKIDEIKLEYGFN